VVQHRVGAAFRVNCPKNYAADPVQQHRPETHQAGLERGIARHLSASRPEIDRDSAQRLNLGVASRVIVWRHDRAGALGDHGTFERDERSNWRIPASLGIDRDPDRPPHEVHIDIYRIFVRPGHRSRRTTINATTHSHAFKP